MFQCQQSTLDEDAPAHLAGGDVRAASQDPLPALWCWESCQHIPALQEGPAVSEEARCQKRLGVLKRSCWDGGLLTRIHEGLQASAQLSAQHPIPQPHVSHQHKMPSNHDSPNSLQYDREADWWWDKQGNITWEVPHLAPPRNPSAYKVTMREGDLKVGEHSRRGQTLKDGGAILNQERLDTFNCRVKFFNHQ